MPLESHFTFERRKICDPYLAQMGDENASHRMDRPRRPGRAWPALVGCRDVQIGPHAQRGNQLGLDAVRQSVAECLSPSANRMKAQSINLSVICSIPLAPLAGASNRRGGASRAAHYPQKQNPAELRGLAVQRTGRRGIGGDWGRSMRAFWLVSRASFGEVQRSLAGLRVIHRQRVRASRSPGLRSAAAP